MRPACLAHALSLSLALALPLAACDLDPSPGRGPDGLTSVVGDESAIAFDSFVDVPAGADDAAVRVAIQRQVKSSLGALREVGIGIEDRDAAHNLDAAGWQRHRVAVVADGAVVGEVDRVIYHYQDTALVERAQQPSGPITLTMLFGDYVARAGELIPACSDDPAAEANSLWYHYAPGRSACRTRIAAETAAIAAATESLDDADSQIAAADADRRFVSVRATLTPVDDAPDLYPEYDRLWGFRGDPWRRSLVVYSFVGVDRDEADPADNGLVEYLRFERTLRTRYPGLRVISTEPFAMLLDFWIDGDKLDGVTFDDVERWVIDGEGFPAQVGSDAGKRAQLLAQVIARFSERRIDWALPVQVSDGDTSRDMTLELRTFYGREDGGPEVRQHAQWRYLEAFWYGDVFAYTGHSHFGYGPLEPNLYRGGNFPDRYQVMLVNSCLSFNYYDQDFLAMHPGGSANLDVVVNGLPAYWRGMGEASGKYVIGLTDGENRTWREVLGGMKVNLPWVSSYDPMRAVNGELDNEYDGAAQPLTVTAE